MTTRCYYYYISLPTSATHSVYYLFILYIGASSSSVVILALYLMTDDWDKSFRLLVPKTMLAVKHVFTCSACLHSFLV